MYNVTKNKRRTTQDIDFDLISFDIHSKESILKLLDILSKAEPICSLSLIEEPKQLNQDDYKGVRLFVSLFDEDSSITTKLDIGIHTLFTIEQNCVAFSFGVNENGVVVNINPYEQILSEKLYSLAKHQELTTRYKDIFDIYYLVKNKPLNIIVIRDCLTLLSSKKRWTIEHIVQTVVLTLSNSSFVEKIKTSKANWVNEDVNEVIDTIIDYLVTYFL